MQQNKNIPYETTQPHKDFAIIQNHFAFAECKTAVLLFRLSASAENIHYKAACSMNSCLEVFSRRIPLEKESSSASFVLLKLHSQLKGARK